MKNFVLVLVLLCIGVAGFIVWEAVSFLNYRSPYSASAEGAEAQEEKILIDVPPGRTFIGVANELQRLGLIKNVFYFRIYARLTVGSNNLKVGEYELSRNMGPKDILKTLSSGHSYARTFTIPEGTNMYEIAQVLESKNLGTAASFLKLFKDKVFIKSLLGEELHSFEGYLYPETYHFTKYTGQKEIVAAMVKNFLFTYGQLKGPNPLNLTRHQIVTMASVIEKETGAPEERPLIGSVFYNRLNTPMRLQSDPTILYGIMDRTGVMKKNISREDLIAHTRYNTYKVDGLPFGPIANPGKESLRAVFQPAQSKYLYFVSRNDGTHVFSETLEQHNNAVRRFQLDRRAREGKSWRDLKSKPK